MSTVNAAYSVVLTPSIWYFCFIGSHFICRVLLPFCKKIEFDAGMIAILLWNVQQLLFDIHLYSTNLDLNLSSSQLENQIENSSLTSFAVRGSPDQGLIPIWYWPANIWQKPRSIWQYQANVWHYLAISSRSLVMTLWKLNINITKQPTQNGKMTWICSDFMTSNPIFIISLDLKSG